MKESSNFRKIGYEIVDWISEYYENIDTFPVKSEVKPGEVISALPSLPPENPEEAKSILKDFKSVILPGITHWQSPNFFAYFPANTSFPSIFAEMITAALGAQCMIWDTSPAAAELEELVMRWLRQMTGLPDSFEGVIQDTASTSTLVALICARERMTGFQVNENGFDAEKGLRVYCSSETHSSIEKAVKIAGFGRRNLVKTSVKDDFSLDVAELERKIIVDIEKGYRPCCVVATLGTTGTTAIDPLKDMAELCRKYNLWLHVDAAFAGSALLLEEYRWMIEGVENADSFVFNPHKWLFTNFDCSAYFVRDKETLVRTFEILPEYLKTGTRGKVNDYRDWGIQLGRRFRALKLWFVIRSYGVNGLRETLRKHISLAKILEKYIRDSDDFEIMAPRTLNLVCFRFHPENIKDENRLNELNMLLNSKLNASGRIFLTHTKLNGRYTLRLVTGQTRVEIAHVEKAWKLISETAKIILTNSGYQS